MGFAPDPWAFTPWEYADQGRFGGRWDDPHGMWRSVYAGQSRLACLLEVLARFRVSPDLLALYAELDEEATAAPTLPPGQVPREWLGPRMTSTARLSGHFVIPGDGQSLSTLRKRFAAEALRQGCHEIDTAVIRDARPRGLTQAMASWFYMHEPLAGVEYTSRHADELVLWAIFERSHDDAHSVALDQKRAGETLSADDTEMREAMRLLHLAWER